MTGTSRERGFEAQGSSSHASDSAGVPTVASLGLQVRLVSIDQNREKELARLIVACESLRNECERLFRRIVAVLNEDRGSAQDGPSSPSDR
ncbi:hypothetical protein [Microvirga lenta]|uniref:hypothetical protein n=1 Tax=Microvirga lenta TaxID=2881337 RepID=UPI001CFE11D7|nr:hypothetical protein [Microvirga lenta]MCB5173580.1 hypothetical protein [Microvirga lenta]